MMDARDEAEFKTKLITDMRRPRWCTKYISPTEATIRDSKALVEKPWMMRAARRYL
jgi:hypothetical protein